MCLDEWLDISMSFISEINYVLDRLNLKVKMINWKISKAKNNLYKQGWKTNQSTNEQKLCTIA